MNLMIRQDSNPSLSISLPYSFHHVSHSSIIFYSLPLFHHLFPSSSVFPINVSHWEPILSRLHPLVPKEKYQAFIDLAIRDFLSSCRREGDPFSMTRKLQETTVARPWARGVSRGRGWHRKQVGRVIPEFREAVWHALAMVTIYCEVG